MLAGALVLEPRSAHDRLGHSPERRSTAAVRSEQAAGEKRLSLGALPAFESTFKARRVQHRPRKVAAAPRRRIAQRSQRHRGWASPRPRPSARTPMTPTQQLALEAVGRAGLLDLQDLNRLVRTARASFEPGNEAWRLEARRRWGPWIRRGEAPSWRRVLEIGERAGARLSRCSGGVEAALRELGAVGALPAPLAPAQLGATLLAVRASRPAASRALAAYVRARAALAFSQKRRVPVDRRRKKREKRAGALAAATRIRPSSDGPRTIREAARAQARWANAPRTLRVAAAASPRGPRRDGIVRGTVRETEKRTPRPPSADDATSRSVATTPRTRPRRRRVLPSRSAVTRSATAARRRRRRRPSSRRSGTSRCPRARGSTRRCARSWTFCPSSRSRQEEARTG